MLQVAIVHRIVDRERHLVGDERQKRHVLCVVRVWFAAGLQQNAEAASLCRQRQGTGRLHALTSHVLRSLVEIASPSPRSGITKGSCAGQPVGNGVVCVDLRMWQRLAGCFQHGRRDRVRVFVVEAKSEEAEPDDRTQLMREAAKERVAIVIGPQGRRHANQRLVTREN